MLDTREFCDGIYGGNSIVANLPCPTTGVFVATPSPVGQKSPGGDVESVDQANLYLLEIENALGVVCLNRDRSPVRANQSPRT